MMSRALTWTLLWFGLASAVFVGIVAGFLVLRLLALDVTTSRFPGQTPAGLWGVKKAAVDTYSADGRNAAPWSTLQPPAASGQPTSGRSLFPEPIVLAARSDHRIAGRASWWASFGPGIYAALPGYVAGTDVRIRVCAGDRCVVSNVITGCQCHVGTPDERIVDLSRDAFARLADPSLGLVSVTVAVLE